MCLFFRFSLIRDEDDELLFHTSMRIEHADGCCIKIYIYLGLLLCLKMETLRIPLTEECWIMDNILGNF